MSAGALGAGESRCPGVAATDDSCSMASRLSMIGVALFERATGIPGGNGGRSE